MRYAMCYIFSVSPWSSKVSPSKIFEILDVFFTIFYLQPMDIHRYSIDVD